MKGSTRRTVSIVLVAALVALAGCGGLGQSDNGGAETGDDTATEEATATTTATEEAGDTATATSTDEKTEATPTATATPTDDGELTSLDQGLLDSHALTLVRTGNYTAFVTSNESGSSTTTIAAVNLAGQGKYDQSTSPGLSIEEYREPGTDTVYTQIGTGDDASYFTETATDNFTANQISESHLITDVNYERFGTDTVGDTTVQRYVANDVASLNVSSDGWGGTVVTNISSVVLVDTDRKLIYEIDAEYTVQTSNGSTVDNAYSVSYSDVGSTNVTEPDWVSDAR